MSENVSHLSMNQSADITMDIFGNISQICSLREISWSATGHLSDRLKYFAGQNEYLPPDRKSLALVCHNILSI